MMWRHFLSLAALVAILADVTGYPSGDFNTAYLKQEACVKLLPGHGSSPQTGPAPYTLSVNGPYWINNGGLTLTLEGTGDTKFRGIMLQARSKNNPDTLVGDFQPVDGTKVNCDGKALTHDSRAEQDKLVVIWNAPNTALVGDVQFVYTIVQTRSTYWVNQKSGFYPNLYDYVPPSNETTTVAEPEPSSAEPEVTTAEDAGAEDEDHYGTSGGAALVASLVSLITALLYLYSRS